MFLAAAVLVASQFGFPQEAKQKAPLSKAKVLTRQEVDNLLAAPDKVLFLDVRRPDELEKHLAEIPRDRAIVTVSNHAARAGRAADLLDSKGFKVIGAVGAETYASEGGKIVKIEAPKQTSGNK